MCLEFIYLRDDTQIMNMYEGVHWDLDADEAV